MKLPQIYREAADTILQVLEESGYTDFPDDSNEMSDSEVYYFVANWDHWLEYSGHPIPEYDEKLDRYFSRHSAV